MVSFVIEEIGKCFRVGADERVACVYVTEFFRLFFVFLFGRDLENTGGRTEM